MHLTKDCYEYLLYFLDNKSVLNALSVNKKFRSDEYFKRIIIKRYPLIMKYKENQISWREYYIQTIYYLCKLKEKDIPYIPTYDFDAKEIYKYVNNEEFYENLCFYFGNKNVKEIIKESENNYHTIGRLINKKYIVETNCLKGSSNVLFIF
jgi:hypothetical protein